MPRSVLLVRWVAGLLIASALLFAVAIVVEGGAERHEVSLASLAVSVETAQAATPAPGEGEVGHVEAAEHAETSASLAVPLEAATHDESNEHARELLFGLDPENPVLVWGFVVVSLLLAPAVLLLGPRALLVAIGLAGVAAILDGREVLLQMGRANPVVASLAGITTTLHLAVVVAAFIAWQSLNQTTSTPRKL